MTERLLHYIWQFQYYNIQQLLTIQEEPLQVIHPGTYNTNQGPDFLNAKLRIGNTTWAGNVELHMLSSEWNIHGHSSDPNYDNVILHVVWKHDDAITVFPFSTLELHDRISRLLLKRYEELMQSNCFIPCETHIASVPELTILSWKERLLVERLQHKTQQVAALLAQNNQHWEETFWWMLARNFGSTVNGEAFETIARSIPINLLAKNQHQLLKIEALLFGQAKLLNQQFTEAYPATLRDEYIFLQKKYRLKKIHSSVYFLRMRPANFPTVRLAQLAMLMTKTQGLFAITREENDLQKIRQLLDITASDYWNDHYLLDEPSAFKVKKLGKEMIENLLINSIVPVLFAYGHLNGHEPVKAKALFWMEQIGAEKNHITKGFEMLGIENKTAVDSQALLQLKNEYCSHKRCVLCGIGNKILKNV